MATFIVTTLNDENDAGETAAGTLGAGLSLREAIALANTNPGADAITFAAGLAGGTIRLGDADGNPATAFIGANGTLSVTGELTIDGDIDNDGKTDITITGDRAKNDVLLTGGITNIFASAVPNKLADNVQIINATAALTLDGLVLTGGVASGDGGAVSGVAVTLTNSTVSGNSAANDGGGISAATADLTNSTVSGNSAAHDGGGIFATTANLTNATVSGNSAANDGGGIHAGNAALTNATVSGNSAAHDGGGVFAELFNFLINATVTGNSAGHESGGIRAGNLTALTNSIVLGNDAPTDADAAADGNLGFDYPSSNIVNGKFFYFVGDDTLPTVVAVSPDQVFAAIDPATGGGLLADNGVPVKTVALKADPSNPAIDAGSSGGPVPTVDARGIARFDFEGAAHNGASVTDLGAYELQGSLVVTTLADVVDANDGLTSLREAIAFANANPGADTIKFATNLNGTIRLDGGDGAGGTVGGTLSITDAVTIDGGGRITISGDVAGDDTTQAGDVTNIFNTAAAKLNDNVRIFDATANLTLDGLILTGGVTSGNGGAISGTTVTITNSTVSGNKANGPGGGISAVTVTLTNSVVSDNESGEHGGGIRAGGGTVDLTGSTVSGNKAGTDGGGIFATISANLINSTVSHNSAVLNGGGIFAAGTANLTNATVSGNGAGNDGGGIVADTVNLTNATISGNSAGEAGGGIYVSAANLTNSIMLGNDALLGREAILFGPLNPTGSNIIGGTFFIGNAPQPGTVSANDVFAETVDIGGGVLAGVLADNGGPVKTIALKASLTNPALDAADNTAPAEDARGVARVDHASIANLNGSPADLGAYELQSVLEAPSLIVTTLDDVVNPFDNKTSLREAILFADKTPGSTITFAEDLSGSITLGSDLPAIVVDMTIDGGGRITIDGDGNYRGLFVYAGEVRIANLTITNAVAKGGNGANTAGVGTGGGGAGLGGALFVKDGASLTVSNVHLEGNAANGGNGGASGTGGGGGGMGGNGGANNGGGGGLGIGANGGAGFGTNNGGDGIAIEQDPGGSSAGGGGGGGGGLHGGGGGGGGGGPGAGGGAGGVGGGSANSFQGGNNSSSTGFGGGGGGATTGGPISSGGTGGFGGGGGGGVAGGGDGGYGGGGGGTNFGTPGAGGFGGGDSIQSGGIPQGGGGGGMGGAIFVMQGGTLIVEGDFTVSDNTVTAGTGATPGQAFGEGFFIHGGTLLNPTVVTFRPGAGVTQTVSNAIADQNGSGGENASNGVGGVGGVGSITKSGDGTLKLAAANTYTGGTLIDGGVLEIGHHDGFATLKVDVLGAGDVTFDGGTLSNATPNGVNLANKIVVDADGGTIVGGHGLNVLGDISGAGDLTFDAGGTSAIQLFGLTNTLEGATIVANGAVFANSTGNLSAASALHVADGAALNLKANQSVGSLNDVNGAGGSIGLFATLGSFTLTIGGDDSNATFSGSVHDGSSFSENLALTKIGTGTQTLAGANTYKGATLVNGGTLLIAAGGSLENSDTTVNDGGTLGGSGTVQNVTVNAGGTLAPGASAGILHTKTLAFSGGGLFKVELDTLAQDQVAVTGTVTIDPDAELDVSLLGDFAPGVGASFVIIDNDDNDAISGTFANLRERATFALNGDPSKTFKITYKGGDGNDVQLMAVTPGVFIGGTRRGDKIDATHAPKHQPKPTDSDDTIFGRGGNDKIKGLGGDDVIIGGKGVDKMTGGDGYDTFAFNSLAELKTVKTVTKLVGDSGGSGRGGDHSAHHVVTTHKVLWDHITDFTSGEDSLDFSQMDADKTQSETQHFTLIDVDGGAFTRAAGELRFQNFANKAIVQGDLNGDGKADFTLVLDHAHIGAGDFILS